MNFFQQSFKRLPKNPLAFLRLAAIILAYFERDYLATKLTNPPIRFGNTSYQHVAADAGIDAHNRYPFHLPANPSGETINVTPPSESVKPAVGDAVARKDPHYRLFIR